MTTPSTDPRRSAERPPGDDETYPTPPESGVPDEVASPAADTRATLLARHDTVLQGRRIALAVSDVTPHDAMVADLLFLRDVLDDAGIPVLLVRGNKERPVLALDAARLPELRAALVAACEREPLYSKGIDIGRGAARLVADGALSESEQTRIFRMFRPRTVSGSSLSYGSAFGVQVELWEFGTDTVELPAENSLLRRTVPRDELESGTVSRFGRRWNTIVDMFADHASDISFDIDLVFSWVDGSSPEYRAVRAARMAEHTVGEGDAAAARYRQIDELRYALRSVHLYAPWVRRIFIATDSPAPHWLADHPQVRLVRSEEFFADTSALPTYNSHAVESQLHRIDGLAEHFLYSNDDMFFGRPVDPRLFFSPGGVSLFIEAGRIGSGSADPGRSGYENAARVNRRLLFERFGMLTTRHLEHAPVPLRRSVMAELEATFPEEFARTAAAPFRSRTDISVTNSLYHYFALVTGRAVQQTSAKVRYIDSTSTDGLRTLRALSAKRSADFFCLNDSSEPELDDETREREVTRFLEDYFPVRGPWEREDS